jgi:hypothetical protein
MAKKIVTPKDIAKMAGISEFVVRIRLRQKFGRREPGTRQPWCLTDAEVKQLIKEWGKRPPRRNAWKKRRNGVPLPDDAKQPLSPELQS